MKLASIALSLASFGTLLSCTDTTTNPVEQLNLDRPVDVAFACWGGLRITAEDRVTASAQPIQSCNIRSQAKAESTDPDPRPAGQEDRPMQPVGNAFWYGLILQSEPGTVAVAKWDTKPSSSFGGGDVIVMDADRLTPGKNSISVGEDPVAIATDKVGCFAMTANAGSCDLSVIDINTVVLNAENTPDAPDPTVQRIDVKDGSGRLIRAKPAAMMFEPAGGTIGEACPAQPTGLVYIAYPSCHLVAGVDAATGTIVTGVQFDAAGVPSIITDPTNVVCDDECGPAVAATPGPRPVTLDLEHDERTGRAVLAIGSDNSRAITVFDLDPTTFHPLSLVPQVTLEDPSMKLGVTSIAVSPVIGMGGASGIVEDDGTPFQHQFVYAVATDGTVRVVDISGAPRECDTQIDPRFIHNVRDIDRLSCLPIGDPTTPRRALAKGPGIKLLGDAVPTSVDFVTGRTPMSNGVAGAPARMIGHFAIVTAANGQTFIVNVDNDDFADFEPQVAGGGIAAPIPLDIAHQLKDAIPDRGLLATEEGKFVCDDAGPDPDSSQGNSGGPRSVGNPVLNIPTNTIAAEKSGGLPSLRQVRCVSQVVDDNNVQKQLPVTEIGFSAPVDVRENVFPDLMGLREEEIWTMTWEGSLSLDKADTAIDGPATRFGQLFVDANGMRLADASRPFCSAGVEPNDILQLRGCDPSLGDAGCPLGYTCYVHPQSQVAGLGACMLSNEAERLATTCSEFLRSIRRYTVATTKTGELQLKPRKAELRTTPINGCTDDAQCEMLADYALKTTSSANPVSDPTGADPKTYQCRLDPDRAPKGTGGTGMRCLTTCETDADCAGGTVCHADTASPRGGYCMEGVLPPQSCINGLQRYELRAGEAFAVLGSRQGFMHPIVADAGGNCVRDPNANPYEVGRVPLSAPACPAGADPRTGRLADGTAGPNPCELTVDETEFQLNYDPAQPDECKLADPDENLVTRQAEAIQFRNRGMTLTLVDPTYQGDAKCVGDRAGTLVNVPLVVPGYQIAFRQTAGFKPLLVPIKPAFPVKVVRGPQDSIWVMDAGDFLSTSLAEPSTRGKVFRVESSSLGTISTLQ
ncbi:MAG: hypothetical protein HOV81_09405 [Kofleriaceae bacterium]|nr:hypothetical protein [Kofleriaceae bacterium]